MSKSKKDHCKKNVVYYKTPLFSNCGLDECSLFDLSTTTFTKIKKRKKMQKIIIIFFNPYNQIANTRMVQRHATQKKIIIIIIQNKFKKFS